MSLQTQTEHATIGPTWLPMFSVCNAELDRLIKKVLSDLQHSSRSYYNTPYKKICKYMLLCVLHCNSQQGVNSLQAS